VAALAKASGVSAATITRFETDLAGESPLSIRPAKRQAVRRTFAAAGVELGALDGAAARTSA